MIPVTFTDIVQLELAAREPAVRFTAADPAVAVTVPPQVFDSPFGVATTNPEGSASANAIPANATVVFGFEIEKVRLVLVPNRIEAAPNVLVIDGGATTVMLAVPVLPVPPFVEVTVTELFCTPRVVPVTFTANVQLAPPASVAPVRLTVEDPGIAEIVPLQVAASPFGVETTNPDGMESVRAMPVRETAFGLLMVKLRTAVPPTGIVGTLKAFPIEGGSTTVRVAVLEVLPVPPSFDVIAFVVLFFAPPVDPVTFTEIVQLPPATMVPLERFTEEDAAVAVTVPPQVSDTPGVVATINPLGRESEKETADKDAVAFELVMVKVRVVLPPSGTADVPKALLIVGGPTTVMLAIAVFPLPASVEVTVTELFCTPATTPVTLKLMLQDAPGASVVPDRPMVPVPGVAAIGPPNVRQPLKAATGLAKTNPGGSVSVNPMPLSEMVFVDGLVIVKASEVVPPTGIWGRPKVLVITGGAMGSPVAVMTKPSASAMLVLAGG
jgi:hypothetical protein